MLFDCMSALIAAWLSTIRSSHVALQDKLIALHLR